MCHALRAVVEANRGLGLSRILDLLVATGAPQSHLEAFLAAEPNGVGSVRDQIVADMTNALMQALGQSGRRTAVDVKRLRERGTWVAYGERPRGLGEL
jgi:hypothetical protein